LLAAQKLPTLPLIDNFATKQKKKFFYVIIKYIKVAILGIGVTLAYKCD